MADISGSPDYDPLKWNYSAFSSFFGWFPVIIRTNAEMNQSPYAIHKRYLAWSQASRELRRLDDMKWGGFPDVAVLYSTRKGRP